MKKISENLKIFIKCRLKSIPTLYISASRTAGPCRLFVLEFGSARGSTCRLRGSLGVPFIAAVGSLIFVQILLINSENLSNFLLKNFFTYHSSMDCVNEVFMNLSICIISTKLFKHTNGKFLSNCCSFFRLQQITLMQSGKTLNKSWLFALPRRT